MLVVGIMCVCVCIGRKVFNYMKRFLVVFLRQYSHRYLVQRAIEEIGE